MYELATKRTCKQNQLSNCSYPKPLTSAEAANWAGIGVKKLLELVRCGEVPAKKLGQTWYFDPRKLAESFGVSPDWDPDER